MSSTTFHRRSSRLSQGIKQFCLIRTRIRGRTLTTAIGTPSQLEILGETYRTDSFTNLSSAIVSKIPQRLHDRLGHPIHTVRNIIEKHFPSCSHLKSPSPLISPSKNFDELDFPLDHPSRSVTDSYYINENTMLRTHTSAHELDCFIAGHTHWSLAADVYRRDEIDASHYPVFHQMECARLFAADETGASELLEDNHQMSQALALQNIIMEDLTNINKDNAYQLEHDPRLAELVTANLKHSLNSLLLKIFSDVAGVTKENPLRVRWIPAYFPWTSPSYEVEVFFRGKWLEILGCGVVRDSMLNRASEHGIFQ